MISIYYKNIRIFPANILIKRKKNHARLEGSTRIQEEKYIASMIYVYRGYVTRYKVKFSQDAGKRAQKESFGRRCGGGGKGRNYVKSLENLSEHFLNSAFARLAYYFYGSRVREQTKRERKGVRALSRDAVLLYIGLEREIGVGSISNMLINDPFERWIGGVGFVRILFRRRRRPTFECQKERRNAPVWRFSRSFAPRRSKVKITHEHVVDPRLVANTRAERNARNYANRYPRCKTRRILYGTTIWNSLFPPFPSFCAILLSRRLIVYILINNW